MCFFWTSLDRWLALIACRLALPSVLLLPCLTRLLLSSRHGFFYVRPSVTAFEATTRHEERETHRRLSMSGERRRLAVTFPVKFSMQGQARWSAAFLRDGYCIITASLHLWNRSVMIFFALTSCSLGQLSPDWCCTARRTKRTEFRCSCSRRPVKTLICLIHRLPGGCPAFFCFIYFLPIIVGFAPLFAAATPKAQFCGTCLFSLISL